MNVDFPDAGQSKNLGGLILGRRRTIIVRECGADDNQIPEN
jgi:hypothetical protein